MTTFGLLDLRGRAPIHGGNGPGLKPHSAGEKGGSEFVLFEVENLPAHSHDLACSADDGQTDEPDGKYLAKAGGGETIYSSNAGSTMNGGAIASTGGGVPLEQVSPFLAVHFIIALIGTYPSQN